MPSRPSALTLQALTLHFSLSALWDLCTPVSLCSRLSALTLPAFCPCTSAFCALGSLHSHVSALQAHCPSVSFQSQLSAPPGSLPCCLPKLFRLSALTLQALCPCPSDLLHSGLSALWALCTPDSLPSSLYALILLAFCPCTSGFLHSRLSALQHLCAPGSLPSGSLHSRFSATPALCPPVSLHSHLCSPICQVLLLVFPEQTVARHRIAKKPVSIYPPGPLGLN